MYTLEAHFHSLENLNVSEFLEHKGVYVIWCAKAEVAPSYIGEGSVIKRLHDHFSANGGRKFPKPIRGYAAIPFHDGDASTKNDALIVEALLKLVADDTDRETRHNIKRGAFSAVHKHFEDHPTVCVNITGFDPFWHPKKPKTLAVRRWIKARKDGDDFSWETNWRRRYEKKSFLTNLFS